MHKITNYLTRFDAAGLCCAARCECGWISDYASGDDAAIAGAMHVMATPAVPRTKTSPIVVVDTPEKVYRAALVAIMELVHRGDGEFRKPKDQHLVARVDRLLREGLGEPA